MGLRQKDELISVIVPAYNAAATIGETLRATLAQTYPNIEVLVVNDGSTDATAAMVAAYATCDPRVHLLHQANAGIAAARNLAIANARGVYIAPLDADDLWHPEKIEAQVAAIGQGGPSIGVVYCWWRRIDVKGLVCDQEWHPYPHEGDLYTALIMGNVLGCASSPLIRKSYLADVGAYDPGLRAEGAEGCEDLKLYLHLAERCAFALVRRFLVGYRARPGSVSSDARRMLRSQQLVLAEARRRRLDLPARLFRLAEARCEYQRGKACLRYGLWRPGLQLILNAVLRDPIGATYRLAEPFHRLRLTRSWQLRGRGLRPDHHTSTPANITISADQLPKSLLARGRSDQVVGRPFLSLSPEPQPGAPLGSTLYGWRCASIAAALNPKFASSAAGAG